MKKYNFDALDPLRDKHKTKPMSFKQFARAVCIRIERQNLFRVIKGGGGEMKVKKGAFQLQVKDILPELSQADANAVVTCCYTDDTGHLIDRHIYKMVESADGKTISFYLGGCQ